MHIFWALHGSSWLPQAGTRRSPTRVSSVQSASQFWCQGSLSHCKGAVLSGSGLLLLVFLLEVSSGYSFISKMATITSILELPNKRHCSFYFHTWLEASIGVQSSEVFWVSEWVQVVEDRHRGIVILRISDDEEAGIVDPRVDMRFVDSIPRKSTMKKCWNPQNT